MLMFRCAFIAVSLDGFLGILFLIFYIIPIYFFNLIIVMVLLAKVHDHRGYACNKKRFVNLACYPKTLLSDILAFYAVALIFAYAVWLIIYLILLLFV